MDPKILAGDHLVGDTDIPLTVRVPPCELPSNPPPPKFLPETVTEVPTGPLGGVMDVMVGGVELTVKITPGLVIPEADAVTVVVPADTPAVAKPEMLITAIVVVDDAHVLPLDRFCVVPSLYVPVATNCCVPPVPIEGLPGVTAIDCNVAADTINVVDPLTAPEVALIVEVPIPMPVAKPDAEIVATVAVAELHVAVLVRFFVVPSL
jgi:hypothetical protein